MRAPMHALAALLLSALPINQLANAQTTPYPSKPIRFVAPFAPGANIALQ